MALRPKVETVTTVLRRICTRAALLAGLAVGGTGC